VIRHAKAPSAKPALQQAGIRLGHIVREVFATRGVARRASGSGAPAVRVRLALALALLGILASASAALAAAPTATIEAPSEVTYTTAHLKGQVNPNGGPSTTCWRFEYVRKAKLEASEEDWNSANFDCLSEEDSAKAEALPVATNLSNLRGGTVYLVRLKASNEEGESLSSEEEFKTKDVTPPSVTLNPVTGITGYTATFSGTVNPNAPEAAPTSAEVEAGYRAKWHFECNPGCDGGEGELAADNSASTVEHEAHLFIRPNRTITVKLVAENAGGKTVAETTFETPKVAPQVDYLPSAPVSIVTDTEARVQGLINPRESGEITDCHFEYGPTASYGSSLPCARQSAISEIGTFLVSADLSGLDPDSTYHFRLVAANSAGSTPGADNHFTTFSAPSAEPSSCPNEARRIEQKATMLPRCRAWERVSPLDKHGASIELESWNTPTAADGSAVSFLSLGSFADTKGAGHNGLTQYVARRGPDGWNTTAITPTGSQNQEAVFAGTTKILQSSEDLNLALLSAIDLPAVSDDLPNRYNVYQEDTRTRELTTVTRTFADMPSPIEFLFDDNPAAVAGTSADQHLLAFTANTRLLPEAPLGAPSVYEWEGGTLRLASILPDGSIASEGANNAPLDDIPGTVSPDGSLVTFFAPKEGQNQLFVRRNHTETVWASEPESSAPLTAAEEVRLQYITPDSGHILFTTGSQLLEEDENSNLDLYMYTDGPNPAGEQNLTLISSGQEDEAIDPGLAGLGRAVPGTSDDGSQVYYVAETTGQFQHFMLWKSGARDRLISPRNGPLGTTGGSGANSQTGARVSPDGSRLAFFHSGAPQAYPVGDRGLTGLKAESFYADEQLYVYDEEKEMLFCVSCRLAAPGSGEEPETTRRVIAIPETNGFEGRGVGYQWKNHVRYLAADGNHIFFSTEEALAPEDKNEVFDAYEYNLETGERKLLSSGLGEVPAAFGGASADGTTVTIVTAQQLVAADIDSLRDAYVVRVDGGFAEPPPPPTPCVGDGCRGPISPAPADASPTTPRFIGPGNPKPKHRKRHRKHRKKKHQRKRNQMQHYGGGAR
jgi:hypothetical protein